MDMVDFVTIRRRFFLPQPIGSDITTVRPGMTRKCLTLIVTTSKPRCRAVAPMSRSGKSMLTPWPICSPWMRPASRATSSVSGCTATAWKSSSTKVCPALAVGVCLGPVDAVRQLHSGHGRERGGGLPTYGLDALQNLRHAFLGLSPAIRMLESRITPMRADSMAYGCQ